MGMPSGKKIFLSAALAVLTAPCAPAQDLPALYKEARAPWSNTQAVRLPLALTTDTLTAIGKNYGAAAGEELAVKKEKVAALTDRFRTCSLNGEDLETAAKYLDKQFKADVEYYAYYGCKAVKESLEGGGAAGQARTASLAGLENFAAGLRDSESSARFFDGAGGGGRDAEPVRTVAAWPGLRFATRTTVNRTELASKVPSLYPQAGLTGQAPAVMPDINQTGRIHRAVNYCEAMRLEGWQAVKTGGLTIMGTIKALGKTFVGGISEAVLRFSDLPEAEEAAARLSWDVAHKAPAKVIAADALVLTIYSGIALLIFVPMGPTIKTALSGSPWAVARLAVMTAGVIAKFVSFFED
jgi:hypothetical protein